MYCVVLNKIKDIYVLRHIIYDVDKNDSLNIIKEKYYGNMQIELIVLIF